MGDMRRRINVGKPRTAKQIRAEIETLQEMKPKVRRYSGFGEDNHAILDAQVRVLEEKMTDDQIWDAWPSEEHDVEMGLSARDAMRWASGKEKKAPHVEWEPLARS
jgi:hypothetical protein